MKPIDLEKTMPLYLIHENPLIPQIGGIADTARHCQREKDAETICERLPSVEEIQAVITGWYESSANEEPLAPTIHAYYASKLKGEQPFCRICGGSGQILVMPKRVLGATYVEGDIQDETLVSCPYCLKGEKP